MGGGGVLYLIYIVYPNPVRLIQRYLVEGGDNHTPPTLALRLIIIPPPPLSVYNIPL